MLLSSFSISLVQETDFTFASALVLFFAMVIGHAFADFPLQGEFMALGKNRHVPPPRLADTQDPPKSLWIYLLTAHSLVHAGFVWIITGSAVLAFAEFILHWAIDALRCDGKTSFAADQALHILCKAVYLIPIGLGWVAN